MKNKNELIYKMRPKICIKIICLALCVYGLIWSNFLIIKEINNTSNKYIHVVDKTAIKQSEMLYTVVMIKTQNSVGSGTIIKRSYIREVDTWEYTVLTNYHVVSPRFFIRLWGADSITGRLKVEAIDTGCKVVVFNNADETYNQYSTKISVEDILYDLAILSFRSDEDLAVAKIADNKMLSRIDIFDEIFTIGCNLGMSPAPTTGIISHVYKGTHDNKEWVVYGSTAQITPGSSGGGLFKEYNGHYYLVGIPYKMVVTINGQFVSHLSYAISIITAMDLINQN